MRIGQHLHLGRFPEEVIGSVGVAAPCGRATLHPTRHLWFPERGMILAFVALVLSHLQLSIVPVVGMKAIRPSLLFPYLIGASADEVKSLHRRRHRLIFGR